MTTLFQDIPDATPFMGYSILFYSAMAPVKIPTATITTADKRIHGGV